MFLFRKKAKIFGAPQYIVCGLGNPGRQYETTRHNAGFLALDFIARKCSVKVNKIKFKSLCATCTISGKPVLLLKPSTYMNRSGQAVVEAASFYKIPMENVVIIYDDVSLPLGKLRIRKKGSDGGHNGVKNIIYLTGKDVFPRIKIGIGQKPDFFRDMADWVLSALSKEEYEAISARFEDIYSSVELIVDGKIDYAMSKYNK